MGEKVIKVLCGFSDKVCTVINKELQEVAHQEGIQLVCVNRYRKEGILQYLTEHPDFNVVILQEALQSTNPYTADDLVELADIRNLNIIISLSKNHFGNDYMKQLYVAGILNAIFEDDAYAANIMKLIVKGRTRKECRNYYGITNASDIENALDVLNYEKLQSLLSYIDSGGPENEIESRYNYVANSLKMAENVYLVKNMSSHIQKSLKTHDLYKHYKQISDGRKRRKAFLRAKSNHDTYYTIMKDENSGQVIEQEKDVGTRKESLPGGNYKTGDRTPVIESVVEEEISKLLGYSTIKNEEPKNKDEEPKKAAGTDSYQKQSVPDTSRSIFKENKKPVFDEPVVNYSTGEYKNNFKHRSYGGYLVTIVLLLIMSFTVSILSLISFYRLEQSQGIQIENPSEKKEVQEEKKKGENEIKEQVTPEAVPEIGDDLFDGQFYQVKISSTPMG